MFVRSNTSILGVPLGLGAGRIGADAGDRAVRMERLHDQLETLGVDVEDCGSLSIPRATEIGDPKARYLKEIAATNAEIAAWMHLKLSQQRFPMVLGGDHSIGAGTVSGAASYYNTLNMRIGVIWIDAHADMNTPQTTPSGNVHGMPLASLLGRGPQSLTHLCGFAPKVLPRNTVLVGIRDIDEGEIHLINELGVRAFTTRDIDERGMFSIMHEAIEWATAGTAGFHLSFDMDALDPTIAPGVGTPVPGGLTYREAHLALEMIADSNRMVSMDVVEVNPMLDAQNLTARVAVGLIASALGKSILPRFLKPVGV
ncbi:MAG: arginase [Candidatus Sumerlaeia bacterium]|nr:arginase [Candidatus Sumerlaeia bacterium]